jgi:type I restriction enzyme S subunit
MVELRFLHYWLLGPDAQHTMAAQAAGATVPHLNVEDIRNLDVSQMPTDSRVQSFAASTLGGLDDLIENNRRRIELLEQMAQAIYREWFVHFRYPGHVDATLVDSPLGPVPEGWNVRNLFDVADVGFGFSFKSKRFAASGPHPVVRIRDVPGGTTKTFSDEDAPERYRVGDDDLLIGMDGEFHLRQWTGGAAWLNQRVARLRPLGGLSARHLMLAVAGPIQAWNAAISGTTVAHLGKRHLEQIFLLVPPDELLALASEVLGSAAEKERSLVQASRKLAGIRDLLLPKLVTGQFDVSALNLDALTESVA